jgi:hypothetical protein
MDRLVDPKRFGGGIHAEFYAQKRPEVSLLAEKSSLSFHTSIPYDKV